MKKLYRSNLIMTSALLLIYLTFWGGIFALPVLGLFQTGITIYIFSNRSKLTKSNSTILNIYIALTISLIVIFKFLDFYGFETISLLFVWMIVSAVLALFHLYLTHRIKFKNEL